MTGLEMVEIPAGRFQMGSVDFYPEEGPVREVDIGPVAIDRGPVTVARVAQFVDETGYVTTIRMPIGRCLSRDRRYFTPRLTRFR